MIHIKNTTKNLDKLSIILIAISIILFTLIGYTLITQHQELVALRKQVKRINRELHVKNTLVDELESVRVHDVHSLSMGIAELQDDKNRLKQDMNYRERGMKSYNLDQPVNLSIYIPYPGDYCNGCFSSTSPDFNPELSGSTTVSGGYDEPELNPKWRLFINYIKNDPATEANSLLIGSKDYNTSIELGNGKRLKDRTSIVFYDLSDSESPLDMDSVRIATFEEDDYAYTFIFEHKEVIPKSVFEDILNSIQFELREGADYP